MAYENLKAAIDQYAAIDADLKRLEKQRSDLRKSLLAAVGDTSGVATLESDFNVLTITPREGNLTLDKEAMKEDGIDLTVYQVRGKPYYLVTVKPRGQKL